MDCPVLGFYTYVDGQWIASPFISKEESRKAWDFEIVGRKIKENAKSLVKAMKFAGIETSKHAPSYVLRYVAHKVSASEGLRNTEIERQQNELTGIGEILIMIYRLKVVELMEDQHEPSSFHEPNYGSKVHEKALKGDPESHGVTYVMLSFIC